jgi:peptide/nickel transport system substrate-binding protein
VITHVTYQELNRLRGGSNTNVLAYYGNEHLTITMNYKYKPWGPNGNRSARLLRQAVAYAIPYRDIIQSDYFGQARPWANVIPRVFPGSISAFQYTTDLNKARQLLAQAGYPEGRGLPSGAPLQLSYVANRASTLEPIANKIRTSLANIGVNIQLNPMPEATFSYREIQLHDIPFYFLDNLNSLGPDVGYDLQLEFVPSRLGGLQDGGNYDNPIVNRAFNASRKTRGAERARILAQAQRQLMRDLPQIPVVEIKSQLATKKGITGWYASSLPPAIMNIWLLKRSS